MARHILKLIVEIKCAPVPESEFEGFDMQSILVDMLSRLVLIDDSIVPTFGAVFSALTTLTFTDLVRQLKKEINVGYSNTKNVENIISVMIALVINDDTLLAELSHETSHHFLILLQDVASIKLFVMVSQLLVIALRQKENVFTFASLDAVSILFSVLSNRSTLSSSTRYLVNALFYLAQHRDQRRKFVGLGGASIVVELLQKYYNLNDLVSSLLQLFSIVVEEVAAFYEDYVLCITLTLAGEHLTDESFTQCLDVLIKLCSLNDDGESYTTAIVRSGILLNITKRIRCTNRSHILVRKLTQFINITLSYSKAVKMFQDAGGIGFIADVAYLYRSDPVIRSYGGSIIFHLCDNDMLQASVQDLCTLCDNKILVEHRDICKLLSSVGLIEVLVWEASNVSKLINVGAVEAITAAFQHCSGFKLPKSCRDEPKQVLLLLCNILSVFLSTPHDGIVNTGPILKYALKVLNNHHDEDEYTIEAATKILLMLSYDGSFIIDDVITVLDVLTLCFEYNEQISLLLLQVVLSVLKRGVASSSMLCGFLKRIPSFVKQNWQDVKFREHVFVIVQVCMELEFRASGQVVLIESGIMHVSKYLHLSLNELGDAHQLHQQCILNLAKPWNRFRDCPAKNYSYCQGTMPSGSEDIIECVDAISLEFCNQRLTQKQSEKRVSWLLSVFVSSRHDTFVLFRVLETLSLCSIHFPDILKQLFDNRNAHVIVKLIQNNPDSTLLNLVCHLAKLKLIALKLIDNGVLDVVEYMLCVVSLSSFSSFVQILL